VEPFGSGVVHVLEEGDEDGGPPGLDRAGEAGRFGELSIDGGLVEVGQSPSDPRRFVFTEEESEAFVAAQAAWTSLMGSQASKDRHSRFHCLLDRCSAPVSRMCRLSPIGSAVVPRRPSRLRVRRCRTSVTMVFATATWCHWSTAIFTPGRAARIPDSYGADGSITTISIRRRNASDWTPRQSRTHPPLRTGVRPSSGPGWPGVQSTKLVIHGSEGRQLVPSRIHRTDWNRVSSMPSTAVGAGSGSRRAAAAISALCAVVPRHVVFGGHLLQGMVADRDHCRDLVP